MNRVEVLPFIQYLEAKRSIDDRALNRHVLSKLRAFLVQGSNPGALRILELGAGIGTMVTRLIDWGVISGGSYIAVDINDALVQEGRRRLGRYASENSLNNASGPEKEIILNAGEFDLSIEFTTADVLEFVGRESSASAFDLLIAHAFLDLVDLPTTLPTLLQALRPDGLFYFTLNFDGITHFEPTMDPELDAQIESRYHASMDARTVGGKLSGDRHTGRHLLGELQSQGADILAAGASDWLVHPINGSYPAQEARFLHFILDTIEAALTSDKGIKHGALSEWLRVRREQVKAGELIYLAHQLDVLGQWSGSPK